jgi:hypothetical protein
VDGGRPRRNPQYRRKARAALAAAKANLKVAELAAANEALDQALAALIDAGEEVAKALLYNAAYEDIVTFDFRRAGERVFLFGESRLKEHDPKQGILVAYSVLFLVIEVALRNRSMDEADRERISRDPDPWIRREFPGYIAIMETAQRLEELRQGRYSGKPKTGRRGPKLSRVEFERLGGGIRQLVEFAEYEQRVFRWKRGDLSKAQATLPAIVRKMNPIVEKAKRRARQAKKRKADRAARRRARAGGAPATEGGAGQSSMGAEPDG